MGYSINDRPLADMPDSEIAGWLRLNYGSTYPLRDRALAIMVGIFRAFDRTGAPQTVRQMFYALVSQGIIAKKEEEYRTVARYLLEMRRRGCLRYHFIADNTRWMRKPDTWPSLENFLSESASSYRHSLWREQPVYVEVWVEKDALAGVMKDITGEWDVPLMVSRGFASESYLYETADHMKAQDKPSYVYYFGDYDPSGVSISQTIERRLREFGADFTFERVAVNEWQIAAWGLPTRPTKPTDTRSRGWQGGSVELDAVPADRLRELVRACIERHVDERQLVTTRETEALERETLRRLVAGGLPGGGA